MGTALTGTTPQDTYDSLIKVTDNGPIDGTAKYLSDGLGNDSVLALSTTALGIGTTSLSGKFHAQATNSGIFFDLTTAYTPIIKAAGALSDLQIESVGSGGNLILGAGGAASIISFFTNGNSTTGERMRITSTGNVGIGTDAPTGFSDRILNIFGATGAEVHLTTNGSGTLNSDGFSLGIRDSDGSVQISQRDNSFMAFATNDTERMRILAAGGLTFNGDTAAANALDDYEEGTWTMGVSFGGASVGVTTSANTGTYTKIGRQVTVNGYLILTSKGSSTGAATITGLPFTVANSGSNYSAPSFRLNRISFANQFQGFGSINTTSIELEEITEAGAVTTLTNADFANQSEAIVSLTYFV